MRPWILVFLLSVGIGACLGLATPSGWGFGPADGLWIGSALYAAGLRRYVERAEAEWQAGEIEHPERSANTSRFVTALLPGLLSRTAVFTALLGIQATLLFHVVPGADVRRGFVLLSAWVVMQALFDREVGATKIREASRLPFR
jgi:hypothetical protein